MCKSCPRTTRVLLGSPDGSLTHPEALFMEISLPPGYRRVWRGAVKPGDVFLLAAPAIMAGLAQWCPLDVSAGHPPIYRRAESYHCVLRPDGEEEVEEPCRRCRAAARHEDRGGYYSYCLDCLRAVKAELRERRREAR